LINLNPTVTKESIIIFESQINDILSKAKIEDDKSDIVNTLTKIEVKLQQLCETRNFLHFKDQITRVPYDKSIEQF
jgi:hypothetical protein